MPNSEGGDSSSNLWTKPASAPAPVEIFGSLLTRGVIIQGELLESFSGGASGFSSAWAIGDSKSNTNIMSVLSVGIVDHPKWKLKFTQFPFFIINKRIELILINSCSGPRFREKNFFPCVSRGTDGRLDN